MTGNFHFIRPWCLLTLLPAVLIWLRILRSSDTKRAWERWVDPPLLDALLVRGDKKHQIRPIHLLGAFWLLGIVALSGPAWQREPSPFAEDTAALVIVLKVTPSMLVTDIAPSRLQRATQKISDLIELRAQARNALVVYAGTAHLVMPLTTDGSIITAFAADLEPELMPKPGDNVKQALAVADALLSKKNQDGALLFIADEISEDAVALFATHRKNGGAPVHILAATENTSTKLRAAARAGGGILVKITPDNSDVKHLTSTIQKTATTVTDGGERWRDAGYWLLPILSLICLLWFRRGWVVVYE